MQVGSVAERDIADWFCRQGLITFFAIIGLLLNLI